MPTTEYTIEQIADGIEQVLGEYEFDTRQVDYTALATWLRDPSITPNGLLTNKLQCDFAAHYRLNEADSIELWLEGEDEEGEVSTVVTLEFDGTTVSASDEAGNYITWQA